MQERFLGPGDAGGDDAPYPLVEKLQVTLPFSSYTAVPGNPEDGGGFVLDEAAETTVAVNSWEQARPVQPTTAMGMRGRSFGPVTAIAIAPDSPIDCCDLWFGGAETRTRHRISVGAPLLGVPAEFGEVTVTLPRSPPNPFEGSGEASQTWLTENDVHDALRGIVQRPVNALDDRAEMEIPLRLLMWRRGFPTFAMTRRAPYGADAMYILTGAGLAYKRLWLCTMGRSTVEITINSQSNVVAQYIIEGHDPTLVTTLDTANTNNRLHRTRVAKTLDQFAFNAGPQGYKKTFTEPFAWYSVRVSHNGGAPRAAISMLARDA
jgi:hypothetical protein